MNFKKCIAQIKTNVLDPPEMRKFFAIFYLVGILGLSMPVSFSFFLKLIPFALLLSAAAIPIFHEGRWTTKTITVFAGIYILSFAVEAIGVNTDRIFGSYEYGDSLGIKVLNTPLIIGLNWVLLVYLSSSVIEKFKINIVLKVIIASMIMLIYDIILEQLATKLDMWKWEDDIIPLRNYIAWFILALAFNSMIKLFGIRTANKLSFVILICQFVFFLSLMFILK